MAFLFSFIFVKILKMYFSLIIPVYNRPDEIDELLQSLSQTSYREPFEIVIIEDGSTMRCDHLIEQYREQLQISYFYKPNSGPGDSRNFGMQKANGDYFIIFDSDCIIPSQYLSEVASALEHEPVACFGGPDKALDSFSDIQKAINFAMTSFLTTGGIRGGSERINKFQPRSFNMGISKKAFEKSGGFGDIHPGEDPDLSIRLWNMGFETRLFPSAFVYHKRRIDWTKFLIQVNKFGKARPILNHWHPKYNKPTYFFPTVFLIGFLTALFLMLFQSFLLIGLYGLYFILLFLESAYKNKSLKIASYSVWAACLQFYGYGTGFLKSFFLVEILKRDPKKAMPELFFK